MPAERAKRHTEKGRDGIPSETGRLFFVSIRNRLRCCCWHPNLFVRSVFFFFFSTVPAGAGAGGGLFFGEERIEKRRRLYVQHNFLNFLDESCQMFSPQSVF